MVATCVLLVAFLVMQTIAWVDLAEHNLVFGESLYAWMFYVLTGLHAIHVLAGLPPAFITTYNAFKGPTPKKEPRARGSSTAACTGTSWTACGLCSTSSCYGECVQADP